MKTLSGPMTKRSNQFLSDFSRDFKSKNKVKGVKIGRERLFDLSLLEF